MSSVTPTPFKPTRWSLVIQARGQGEQARRALEDLCQAYWFPLYSWCRQSGVSVEDAEDYVQGFFIKVFERELFVRVDPALGKLRTFLLKAFRRFVKDEQNKLQRQKRGGGQIVSFDAIEAESWYVAERLEGETADHMYDRQWALTVLENAMTKLELKAESRGKSEEFSVLRHFLSGESDLEAYEKAGRILGKNANTIRVAVHRLRSSFGNALRSEISDTQPLGSNAGEEMTYLMEVLSNAAK